MVYSYSFSVWPDETRMFPPAVFDLFELLKGRVEMDFSEARFDAFRSSLADHGLMLREIERVPFREPETIL